MPLLVFFTFFSWALGTLTVLGFYLNANKDARSLFFRRRGSEVGQVLYLTVYQSLRKTLDPIP